MNVFKRKTVFIGLLVVILLSISLGLYISKFKSSFESNKVKNPVSYKELYDRLKVANYNYNYKNSVDQMEATPSMSKESDYSETNIQVEGVDESDIVKTDGEYIYSLFNDYLNIFKVDDGVIEKISTINTEETKENKSSFSFGMYLKGNKLIILKKLYPSIAYGINEIIPRYDYSNIHETIISIYNIEDRSNPKLINELTQSGTYVSSRLIDNNLYIVTNYYVNDGINYDDINTFVPKVRTNGERTIKLKDITILPKTYSNSYLVITGTDINDSDDFISTKAILGNSSDIYADLDSLYVASYYSESFFDFYTIKTNIIKFSLDKGKVSMEASGVVNGKLLNQFSMDEYDNYFRVVTTSVDSSRTSNNNLYILDKNLKVKSKLEDLAKEERVYSVRFDKEIVYFVTFKQVDPLFVADLSDPLNPVIKSELKIPGFSDYLHVYNEKYLFGLGYDADLEGRAEALKISMFDIQDKLNVKEKFKTLISDEYSWSEASYNHKAILISSKKNIIAFPYDFSYVIYKFDEETGFEKLSEIDFSEEYNEYFYSSGRGIYIDDYIYVLSSNQITSMNLLTLEKIGTLKYNTTINQEQ